MLLDEFDSSLTEGLEQGMVPDSPEAALEQARVPALRRWLHWLGYLRRDNKKAHVDKNLIQALERFALEAELEVQAGWTPIELAVQLWEPVRDLVAFEREDQPDFLATEFEQLTAAARRALALRLHAFGMIPEAPREKVDERAILRGLEQFRFSGYALHLIDDPLSESAAMRLLFDQEAILAQLGAGDSSFSYRLHPDWSKKERKAVEKAAQSFIKGAACVELWLRGYDTGITTRVTVASDGGSQPTLAMAMRHYWKDQSDEEGRPKREWQLLDGRFFRNLKMQSEQRPDEEFASSEVEELVEQTLQEPREIRSLRKSYRSLLTVVWDGVKRAALWIFRFFKRTANALMQGIRNLARIVKGGVMEVAPIIGYMVKGIRMSMNYLFSRRLPGSDPETLMITRDFDFDMRVFAHAGVSDERARLFARSLKLMSGLLEVSFEFLALLFSLFRRLIRGVATVLGWLGVVLAIFRLRKLLEVSKSLAESSKRLALTYEEITALS